MPVIAVIAAAAAAKKPQKLQYYNVTNYVDQQTLKPDNNYILPHQRLWTFDVLICPLSVTEHFLLQPLIFGTVFHCTSLLPPLSRYFAVVLNHISSHFLIPLSDPFLICAVPMQ